MQRTVLVDCYADSFSDSLQTPINISPFNDIYTSNSFEEVVCPAPLSRGRSTEP